MKILLKHTEKIWNEVCQCAGEENVAEWRVLGLLLTRSSNKDAKRIGQELWTNTKSEGKLPVEPAMTMMMDSKLGRATYNSQRKLLDAWNFNILPPWIDIRRMQHTITPQIHYFDANYVGVYFSLTQSMEITAKRILSTLPEFNHESLQLYIKFRFDGSGSHAIYNQINN